MQKPARECGLVTKLANGRLGAFRFGGLSHPCRCFPETGVGVGPMKNRAIVPAFLAVSLIYAVCVSNVPAVELLSRMTSKLGKAEAKCGAAVQKSAKQKGASAKKGHRNVLSSLVSQIQKGVAPKSDGKAKAAPKKKSAAQKSAKKESAAQKSAKKKGGHALLEGLLSHISDAVQPKQKSAKKKSAAQKSAKKKSAAQKSAKKKSAAQKSAKKKSAAQKSAKSGGHFRKLLDRVVRRMEPKCGSEVQGKKASAGKHHDHDDATPPPAPAVSNEA